MASGADNSPLMGLPGEVRNRIYRYAVVEPGGSTVSVTASGIQEPGLLSTCKVMRQEAGSIFYGENEFTIECQGLCCDAACFWKQKHARSAAEFDIELVRHRYAVRSAPNWKNLLKWLQHYHEGGTDLSITPTEDDVGASLPTVVLILRRMFYTVDALRDKSWTTVESLLLQDREVMRREDAQWGQ